MAGALQTKQELALSLKTLLQTTPFEKISIGQICEGCGMNRKSFYYHFIDKYDLVNWIFDFEYISSVSDDIHCEHTKFIYDLSSYIYNNKDFYKKVFKITGQNSFTDHFKEALRPIIQARFTGISDVLKLNDFSISILLELMLCAYTQWLSEPLPLPPDKFVALIEEFSNTIYLYLSNHYSSN